MSYADVLFEFCKIYVKKVLGAIGFLYDICSCGNFVKSGYFYNWNLDVLELRFV